ncbi:TolB family protein [Pseudoalteromonas luteoviolacea]|uniref:Dipeptidylpeptidase IV N-terminal domain-containing protein n=1 Tax=Pseudoalteromonas luteoviolacea NCIMB 1942 TaxID=1365253 RepID=A0A166Z643_9GAMM|nr:PD40 domain-containing protein [Pseudoalteromonas luteoviolacea]KZN43975.1 hypothetical protein N482_18250 [Pseudoalteromonas luteoviolacea NCIMB 1942]
MLINDSTDNLAPSLSPDGTQIVYLSNRDGNQEVYTMDIDGNNHNRMTFNTAWDGDSTWSADGKHLFFVSDNRRVFLMYLKWSEMAALSK